MDNFQENNIRPPDEVISEQLINDGRSDFQKQLDEAIYLSIQEINQQREINIQYEEQLLKEYSDETNRRTDLFKNFKVNMIKLSKFDKEIKDVYNIIEPIIDSYCGQYIQTCELDKETYNKIFSIIKKIRNEQIVFNALKEIILIEE